MIEGGRSGLGFGKLEGQLANTCMPSFRPAGSGPRRQPFCRSLV